MPTNAMIFLIGAILVGTRAEPTCDAATATPLSEYAHTSNEEFIAKVTTGRAREFSPSVPLAMVTVDGRLVTVDPSERFFTYVSDNGWNNQMLNLLCAIDMARRTNRTLIVPPFMWKRRRGNSKVSVGRLIDLRSLASLGVRVLCEDESGSVQATLAAAGVEMAVTQGEGQPHRKSKMPRWSHERWEQIAGPSAAAGVMVTCCLFWTWPLSPDVARELYAQIRYHPTLERAAREAAAPLGDGYAAMREWPVDRYRSRSRAHVLAAAATQLARRCQMPYTARSGSRIAHQCRDRRSLSSPLRTSFESPLWTDVRRGDKASVDSAYKGVFGGKMTPEFFLRLARDEGILPDAVVYVATDELDRSYFAPMAEAGLTLRFVDDLDQGPLLDALTAYPQPVWADILAILEQIVCIHAGGGFVGSLPSTLSGHVINARAVASGSNDERPLFTKLHESCCDARTALDLLRLPGVTSLADVPCVAHAGNSWC